MKKFLKVLSLILGLAAAFALGFGSKMILDRPAQSDTPDPDPAPQLRIYDSCIQWSDGVRWHIFGDTDALAAADPIASAQEQTAPAEDAPDAEDETADPVLALNRGTGSVAGYYSGGGGGYDGGYSGGGGGGSDGQDISWSGDYL